MYTADADFSPAERLRQIATILASGILRQRTVPESTACTPESATEKRSDSSENCLDVSETQRTHVHAG